MGAPVQGDGKSGPVGFDSSGRAGGAASMDERLPAERNARPAAIGDEVIGGPTAGVERGEVLVR